MAVLNSLCWLPVFVDVVRAFDVLMVDFCRAISRNPSCHNILFCYLAVLLCSLAISYILLGSAEVTVTTILGPWFGQPDAWAACLGAGWQSPTNRQLLRLLKNFFFLPVAIKAKALWA